MRMNNRIPRQTLHAPSGNHLDDGQDCSDLEKELNAYIDGELPVEHRQALELRLVTDSETRSRADELAHVQALFRLAYGVILR